MPRIQKTSPVIFLFITEHIIVNKLRDCFSIEIMGITSLPFQITRSGNHHNEMD